MLTVEKAETLKLRFYLETLGDNQVIRNIKFDEKVNVVKEKVEGFVGIPR